MKGRPPKVTDAQVQLIRQRLAGGQPKREIAAAFGVSRQLVSAIHNCTRRRKSTSSPDSRDSLARS